jgi:hypothetical protein
MKLGFLLNSTKILERVSAISLNGKQSYKRRKCLEPLEKEIKTYYKLEKAYIEEHGIEKEKGHFIIPKTQIDKDNLLKPEEKKDPIPNAPLIEEFTTYLKYMQEMTEAEIDKAKPLFTLEELDSLEELVDGKIRKILYDDKFFKGMLELGLIEEPEEPKKKKGKS